MALALLCQKTKKFVGIVVIPQKAEIQGIVIIPQKSGGQKIVVIPVKTGIQKKQVRIELLIQFKKCCS